MVFHFNQARELIAKKLVADPYYSFTLEGLVELMPERLEAILNKCSSQQIARLHYHIDTNHDMEDKVINANVEFVRMGVLKERSKEKDRKSSGMVRDGDLKEFLDLHSIDYDIKEVDRNAAIQEADAIDSKLLGATVCNKELQNENGGELPPVLKKNNKKSEMRFISTWDLARATMNGKFCGIRSVGTVLKWARNYIRFSSALEWNWSYEDVLHFQLC